MSMVSNQRRIMEKGMIKTIRRRKRRRERRRTRIRTSSNNQPMLISKTLLNLKSTAKICIYFLSFNRIFRFADSD